MTVKEAISDLTDTLSIVRSVEPCNRENFLPRLERHHDKWSLERDCIPKNTYTWKNSEETIQSLLYKAGDPVDIFLYFISFSLCYLFFNLNHQTSNLLFFSFIE